MENNKIANKFIPKTNSHTPSRIFKIINNINKNKLKNKQISFKTYKNNYKKQLLIKNKTKTKSKSKSKSKSKTKSKSKPN